MAERFVDNGDGTVTDTQTGLVWQKYPAPERMSWPEARKYLDYLNQIKFAGYDDWRLPNNKELGSLILPRENSKRLYLDPIFGDQRKYWSCETREHHEACYVDYYYGGVYRFPEKYVNHAVRAVRGEMKAEADEKQAA